MECWSGINSERQRSASQMSVAECLINVLESYSTGVTLNYLPALKKKKKKKMEMTAKALSAGPIIEDLFLSLRIKSLRIKHF